MEHFVFVCAETEANSGPFTGPAFGGPLDCEMIHHNTNKYVASIQKELNASEVLAAPLGPVSVETVVYRHMTLFSRREVWGDKPVFKLWLPEPVNPAHMLQEALTRCFKYKTALANLAKPIGSDMPSVEERNMINIARTALGIKEDEDY